MQIRRTKKFIKPRFQSKLILIFCLTAAISALLQTAAISIALGKLAGHAPNDEILLLRQVAGIVRTTLMATLAIMLPLIFMVGIVLTHRVAGPIHRFESYLGDLAKGGIPGPCRIRKSDEFQGLCKLIEQVTAPIREARVSQLADPEAVQPQTDLVRG